MKYCKKINEYEAVNYIINLFPHGLINGTVSSPNSAWPNEGNELRLVGRAEYGTVVVL